MKHQQKGATTILIALLLGVFAVSTAVLLSRAVLLQVSFANTSKAALAARQQVQGCLEEVLIRLTSDPAYTDTSITTSDATCVLTIVSSGNSRDITVGISADIDYAIFTEVDLVPSTVVTSFTEQTN